MSYLVIARKFRPQTFASIIGQEHITKALANSIIRDRIPHALLFTGPRGVGKTTTARVFARALNCTGRDVKALQGLDAEAAREGVEPCGSCTNCKEIAKSSSIAVWEIDGASNNSVDNVRELIESLRSLPPSGSAYKIYIIDEVHMLSVAAFNALLKSLEEPPPNTVFIFATTEPHKIPETVISRCQRHDFRSVSAEQIVACLRSVAESEKVTVDDEVFELIARRAQGGLRDAQSMFDRLLAFSLDKIDLRSAQQAFGMLDRSFFFKLSTAVIEGRRASCIELIDEAFKGSLDLRSFIGDFVGHFRNLLVLKSTGPQDTAGDRLRRVLSVSVEEYRELEAQTKQLPLFEFQRLFDLAERTADLAFSNNFPRFVLEAGLVKMASHGELKPLPEIMRKLEGVLGGEPGGAGRGAARTAAARTETASPAAQPPELPAAPEKTNGWEEDAATEAAVQVLRKFNPSWQDFVAHVRSRKKVMLASILRRVSPSTFSEGLLEIQAQDFDLNSLKDNDNLEALKNCLHSYSGVECWTVDLKAYTEQAKAHGRDAESKPHLKGSIAALEASADVERAKQVDQEARSQSIVKSALETFTGSKIEKVLPLKLQRP